MSKIRRLLGLESPEDRMQEYQLLKSQYKEVGLEAKELAEKFAAEKSIIKGLEANAVPYENFVSVLRKHTDFMKSHTKDVADCFNRRNNIVKAMDELAAVDTAIADDLTKSRNLEKADSMYAAGKLNRKQYFALCKSITGEPTKYADVVAMAPDGRILILHRVDDFVPNGTVCIPGGHVDAGEDFQQAALRELKEETNLDPIPEKGIRLMGEHRTPDADIRYYQVFVDPRQPVTVDASEHCFAEWIDMGEIPFKNFIFDQGKQVLDKMMSVYSVGDFDVIKKGLDDGVITPAQFRSICSDIVKKALSTAEAAPLMPESMEGEVRKLAVPVRDPMGCLETILKGISGSEAVVVNNAAQLKFVKPLFIKDVSYASDPASNRIVEAEIAYIGDDEDIKRVLHEMKISLMGGGSVKFGTTHEEFMNANERGTDYIGDPIISVF